MSSNPLPYFLGTCCDFGNDYFVSYGELYTSYITYLRKHKKRKVKRKEFKAALEDEGVWVEKESKNLGDEDNPDWKSGYWVLGVRLKDNWKELVCDNYDNFQLISNSFSYKGNKLKTLSQMSQMSQNKVEVEEVKDTIDWDEKSIIYHPCHFEMSGGRRCGDSPTNEYDGLYYCKTHFKEVQRR